MYLDIDEKGAKKRKVKTFGPFKEQSSDYSTDAAQKSGSFTPTGSIDRGLIHPTPSPFIEKEQKGLTPVERTALELSIKRHKRALKLLAQH